ncbi:hypothetical protein GCM10020331_021200 [Ectobacillus funiculus]
MRDLQDETWIVREIGSGTREAAEKLFDASQIRPEHMMEFGSNQVIKESVEAGLGITLLSKSAVRKEQKLGTLIALQIDGLPLVRNFFYYYEADEISASFSGCIFLQLLRAEQ